MVSRVEDTGHGWGKIFDDGEASVVRLRPLARRLAGKAQETDQPLTLLARLAHEKRLTAKDITPSRT